MSGPDSPAPAPWFNEKQFNEEQFKKYLTDYAKGIYKDNRDKIIKLYNESRHNDAMKKKLINAFIKSSDEGK